MAWCMAPASCKSPSRNNEAQAQAVHLMHHFVAPYARGHGLARLILRKAEERARALGFRILNLDVRATQLARHRPYESGGLSAGARIRPMPGSRAASSPGIFTIRRHKMTLTLYPAIDLKDGACVRLLRGDMAHATVFGTDPGAQAASWQQAGFGWVHVVDLNGAFAGKPVNEAAVKSILAAVSVPVQLGGGIRTIGQIEAWLAAGVTRVILGSAAAKNPALVREAAQKFPGPHRRRYRRQGRDGGDRGLGRDFRYSGPHAGAALRGCGHCRYHLYRHRP